MTEALVLFSLEDSFEITPVGLRITGQPSFDAWQRAGNVLQVVTPAVQWCLGDWILAGEQRYGEMYAQALDATAYAKQSLADIVWVCRNWPYERRRADLSFQHHRVCAPMTAALQDVFMTLAAEYHLSASKLSRVVKRFMDGCSLETSLTDAEAPLVISPTSPLPRQPRLICNTAATIRHMTDDSVTLALSNFPAVHLEPGVSVYVKIIDVVD